MNDKEYGIKLNLDITDLKKKLNEAKEITSKTKEKIEEPLRKVKITEDGMEREFTMRTKKAIETIEDFEKRMADVKPKIYNNQGPDLLELEKNEKLWEELRNKNVGSGHIGYEFNLDDLKEATNDMEDLGEETEKTKDKTKNFTNIFAFFGNDVSKGINKAIKSIKRFSLSLLGIQSIYSMLRRATSSYMAQDEELHNKMQANWIALGAIVEPIVTRLINLFTKLVGYINIFVKTFTGGKVDLIGKALDVVNKKTSKTRSSLSSMNKELANFDEITNINMNNGGGGIDDSGIPSIADYLNEINNMELNPKVVEVIEKVANKLKDVWDWIVKNKDWLIELGKVIATVFVVTEVAKFIKKIKSLFDIVGTAVGEGGSFSLWALAIAGIVFDLEKAYELIGKINELIEAKEAQQKQEKELMDSNTKIFQTINDKLKETTEKQSTLTEGSEEWNELEKKKNTLLWETEEALKRVDKEVSEGKKLTEEQRKEIEKQVKAIEKVSGKTFETTIRANLTWTEKAKKALEGIIFVPTGGDGGGGGTHFAKGNVAYEPTYAEFGEYSGANTNPEITTPQNIMRETLFEALSQALPLMNQGNNKQGDIVLNVNGREFARATYPDYQKEGQRMGSSNIAIRRG